MGGGGHSRLTPEQLAAVEEIKHLKARYWRCIDQKRWDDLRKVFTDDVHIDCTDDGIPAHDGADDFVASLQRMLEATVTVHHGHAPEIRLTGEGAGEGVWAMEDTIEALSDSPFPFTLLHGSGWYEERYVRGLDGAWRIASMVLRRQRVVIDGVRTFPR